MSFRIQHRRDGRHSALDHLILEIEKRSPARHQKRSGQGCAPVVVSMSCPVMRRRSPDLRTLPFKHRIARPAPGRPASRAIALPFLQMKLEFRAITIIDLKHDNAVVMSSTIPVSKIVLFGIATHVSEGQDGNRGTIGERRKLHTSRRWKTTDARTGCTRHGPATECSSGFGDPCPQEAISSFARTC